MLLDLGFLLIVASWSLMVGRRLLLAIDPRPRPAIETVAQSVPIGLGTLALGALALGEAGRLNHASLVVYMATLTLLAAVHFSMFLIVGPAVPAGVRARPAQPALRHFGWNRLRTMRTGHRLPSDQSAAGTGEKKVAIERPCRGRLVDRAFLALLVFGLLGSLLSALLPVTDGDALCYHLQVPKVFLAAGGVFFDPDLHETVYPLLTEFLYAVALAFRGPVACRLVQWLLGLVFALNVTALARPYLGPRAWWAGAVGVLVPAVSNGMSAPLNDVSLAAFGTAALVAWSRFHDRPDVRSVVLAGGMTGLALGVKYPALVLAGLLGSTIAAQGLFPRPASGGHGARIRGSLSLPIIFGLAAIATGGWWYLRASLHTGNPVYPFFRHYFGGAGIDAVLDPSRRSMPVTVGNLLSALGLMTLQPQRFDSFSHQFGPVFLLFVPALLLERAPRRLLGLVALGYVFLMLCLTQRQSTRFVLITAGPLSVAAAWLAHRWTERRTWPTRLLVGAMLLCLTMEVGLAATRSRQGLKVLAGRETAEQYLERREPTYRVGRWVAANLAPDARILGQDHRGFYFPRAYTMELAHRRRTGLGRRNESAETIVEALRREGFSHVMLCPPVPEHAVEFDPTLGRLLGPWLDAQRPLYQRTITDGDGVARRYAIYGLADGRTALADGRARR